MPSACQPSAPSDVPASDGGAWGRAPASPAFDLDAGDDQSAPVVAADAARPPSSPSPQVEPFPLVGEWDPLPGTSTDCGSRIARDPAASVPPLKFRACASGREGCEVFVADWSPRSSYYKISIAFEDTQVVGGVPIVVMQRLFVDGDVSRDLFTVGPIGGAPLVAVWTDPRGDRCGIHFGLSRNALTMRWRDPSGESDQDYVFASAGWSTRDRRDYRLTKAKVRGGRPFDPVYVNSRYIVSLQDNGSATGVAFDAETGAMQHADAQGRYTRVWGMVEVADGVVFVGLRDPLVLGFFDGRSPARTIRVAETGDDRHGVWDVAVDRSRGDVLVWREADRRPNGATNVSLWTAPYQSNGGAVVPRRVTDLPDEVSIARVVANAGVALMHYTEQEAMLVRLSDGKRWRVPTQPGVKIADPLWVDDNDVWLMTTTRHRSQTDGILRIARRTLID